MPEITIEHVARIEGHGNIKVAMSGGKLSSVEMEVVEPARFVEAMLVGRRFDEAPLITSRICGICSPNHFLTSTKAVEAALGVEVSERTRLLRKLAVYGSYLQNHATHLYLFAAPDFVGLPSAFPLAETHPDIIGRALRIKKLGNDLTTLTLGRSVHPITPAIGGFTSEPGPADLEAMQKQLITIAEDAFKTLELFGSFEYPALQTSGEMLAMVDDDDYAIYEGDVAALDAGWRRPVSEYPSFINEMVTGQSNAKHSTTGGKPFLVGALARINLSEDRLTPLASRALQAVHAPSPARNPFYQNVAQAVELVDCAERCAGYIQGLLDGEGSTAPVPFTVAGGSGAGATEAPRGTLYHSYSIDDDGIITKADVITPTAQNLANLEADMWALAEKEGDRGEREFGLLMEQLVRAYDPCLSCSVH